jgi:hypothetical protein
VVGFTGQPRVARLGHAPFGLSLESHGIRHGMPIGTNLPFKEDVHPSLLEMNRPTLILMETTLNSRDQCHGFFINRADKTVDALVIGSGIPRL